METWKGEEGLAEPARFSLVSVPDPNQPQHGSHLHVVSRVGREGLAKL